MTLAEEFENFGEWAVGNAPLYERLASAVADDPELLALAERVPEDKSAPHVLFAAVHASLLADPDHELAAFYPTVADEPRDPDAAGAELAAAFADFCREREAELVETFETRRTQTNAVGRSAALYPAFTRVALDAGVAPALIEVGPSAGLNLLFDRYAYEYGRPGDDEPQRVGVEDSPVTIESEVRAGDPPIPSDPPPIACRIGVDLEPLDPTDPDDRRWIRALAWPEHEDRHRRLGPALELAAEDPPQIVRGDATERLPELVADVPDDVPICVVDTLVRYQFSDEAREAYEETLAEIGAERELYWLSMAGESDEYEQGIPLQYSRPGSEESEQLGIVEMHGRWLRWDE